MHRRILHIPLPKLRLKNIPYTSSYWKNAICSSLWLYYITPIVTNLSFCFTVAIHLFTGNYLRFDYFDYSIKQKAPPYKSKISLHGNALNFFAVFFVCFGNIILQSLSERPRRNDLNKIEETSCPNKHIIKCAFYCNCK